MFKHTLSNTVRRSLIGLCIAAASGSGAVQAAGMIAAPTDGDTRVAEGGKSDYYTLRLDTAPQGNVTVTFATKKGQVMTQPQAVVFTPDNYNVPVPIAVSAVDDKAPEGPDSDTILHNVTSQDSAYNMPGMSEVSVDIIDNDLGSILISKAVAEVTEGGASDSYTISLSARPAGNVTVSVQRGSTSAQTETTPSSVTFSGSDWQPRTITIKAIDDPTADGTKTENLMHTVTSSDTAFTQSSLDKSQVSVTVNDNDVAGVLVSRSEMRVAEGGPPGSYTLKLATRPQANVSVDLSVEGGMEQSSQLSINPKRVTFTPLNYTTPQTVTVGAVDDPVGEGRQALVINHVVAPGAPDQAQQDMAYKDLPVPSVDVAVVDDDVPAVVVGESGDGTEVAEGGARDSYTLVLTTRPAEEVSIDVRTGSQLSAEPARVTFTPDNFDQPRTVTLTALDDRVVEDTLKDTVTHAIDSQDFGYASGNVIVDDVIATVSDNDRRGVLVVQSGGSTSVSEGAEEGDVYNIELTAQPAGTVTVTLDADAFLLTDPATLTFTADDFGPKPVIVRAADDATAQGTRYATIRHTVASDTDSGYDGLPVAEVSVSIADNDVAGVLLQESDGSTRVTEGGTGDYYTLRLATRPQADVVVQVNAGSQLQASRPTLTFTPDNYDQPQSVEISALDDAEVQGDRFQTVTHGINSSDPAYRSGLSLPTVSVAIEDNDTDTVPEVPEVPDADPPPVQKTRAGGSLDTDTLMVLVFAGLAGLLRLARRWNLG